MRRAFSLVETMVVMVLFGMLLGVFAGLVRTYGRVNRFVSEKDTALESLRVGLQTMRSEVAEAVAVDRPARGSTGIESELVLRRVDPQAQGRLPQDPEPDPTDFWRPHESLIQVRYHIDADRLMRNGLPVAQSSGISLQRVGGSLELAVTTTEQTRVRRLSTLVRLNEPPAVVGP